MINNNKNYGIEREKSSLDDDLEALDYEEERYLSDERAAFLDDCSIVLSKPAVEAISLQDLVVMIESKTGVHARRSGQGYMVCCPAHDDKNPSLSVSEGIDRKILMKCFGGCTFEAICGSLGIEPSALFPAVACEDKKATQKRIEYLYKDEQGNVLYWKVRIEPGFNGNLKSFFCERQGPNGQPIKDLKDCRKVLYRLPELLRAIVEGVCIFLAEGEKDADKLAAYGLVASTTHATSFWCDEFTEILKHADVVVLYDMDKAGIERRDRLSKSLFGKVKRLRVIDLPGLEYSESHGKDVSDWLAAGNTISQLQDLVNVAPDYVFGVQQVPNSTQVTKQVGKICVVSMEDFLSRPIPPREMLLSPFLPTQGLVMLYAYRGVGKTHVALGIAYAVASGGCFLKWEAPIARKVLYIDGEMPAFAIQERLRKIVVSDLRPVAPDFFRLITPDLQEDVVPDLSVKEGRDKIGEIVNDSDLVIVDNISTLFRCGNENEAESWQAAQDWALTLRRQGKSILFVHHAGKTGHQRGTSKREDILDSVINLKRPNGYKSEQGACFEVHFDKARGFTGEDAASFVVELKEQDNGTWKWEVDGISMKSDVVEQEILKVVDLKKQKMTIGGIMKETGLTKSQVETRIAKARAKGLIPD
jgi:hypothetical protein